jgi:hypothetical protein
MTHPFCQLPYKQAIQRNMGVKDSGLFPFLCFLLFAAPVASGQMVSNGLIQAIRRENRSPHERKRSSRLQALLEDKGYSERSE